MADGLNRVMLLGNIAADPTLRYTQQGQAVLNMRLACNEKYKDKSDQWKDRCEFVSVVIWGKRGEALSKFLSKGSQIYVEGGLRTSTWEDNQGQKWFKTEVQASNVILCGGKGEGGRGNGGGQQRQQPQQNQGQDELPPDDFAGGDEVPF